MTANRMSLPALALLALMGCAGDKGTNATTWQHPDGSPVSAGELAQDQAACRQAATRPDSNPNPFNVGNPAYHPGGIGLETTTPPGDFGFTSRLMNVAPTDSDNPERIEACLGSRGIVRVP
jgi:hypothetical protein